MLAGDSAMDHVRGDHDLKVAGGAAAEVERRLRGCVGGAIDGYGESGADTRAAARRVVVAGARVLTLARAGERELAGRLRVVTRNAQQLGQVVRSWRWHTARGGPGRMAALRELSAARQEVCEMVLDDGELTDSDKARILACPPTGHWLSSAGLSVSASSGSDRGEGLRRFSTGRWCAWCGRGD